MKSMITWDEAKREKNLKAHGIDLTEVSCVLDAPMVTVEDEREQYGDKGCKVWLGFATALFSWYGRSAMKAPE